MLVIPALDLRGGHVVRLHKGDFQREKVYADDVVGLAERFAFAGASRLHVVDLDAARGSGDNRAVVERLVRDTSLQVQVAGGVRSAAVVDGWLELGAAAVVMGTIAVRAPELLAEVAASHPGRVVAALDARAGRPAVDGWSAVEDTALARLLERWNGAPLAGVVVTSVDRDGTLSGPDLGLLEAALAATHHPVTYSGGVASLADLRAVASAGAASVILGKSLLEGLITLSEALAVSRASWPC